MAKIVVEEEIVGRAIEELLEEPSSKVQGCRIMENTGCTFNLHLFHIHFKLTVASKPVFWMCWNQHYCEPLLPALLWTPPAASIYSLTLSLSTHVPYSIAPTSQPNCCRLFEPSTPPLNAEPSSVFFFGSGFGCFQIPRSSCRTNSIYYYYHAALTFKTAAACFEKHVNEN